MGGSRIHDEIPFGPSSLQRSNLSKPGWLVLINVLNILLEFGKRMTGEKANLKVTEKFTAHCVGWTCFRVSQARQSHVHEMIAILRF